MVDFETEFARRNALLHALAMASCLHDQRIEIRETAEASLILSLPSVHPNDRDWITAEEMRALLNAISATRPDLTIAILQALKQIGDRYAIPYVEGLFREIGSADDENADRPRSQVYDPTVQPERRQIQRLRAEANDCLVRLRELAARARQSESLLRASRDPGDAPCAILLRPADASSVAGGAELLRPGSADE